MSKKRLDDSFGLGDAIDVIIETPKQSRNKYKFDAELQKFRLAKVLPAGQVFPYDFGFVPGTLAEDGDPIDVLLMMDDAVFPGCVVAARLIGMIEAEQSEGHETVRNDRLVAVAEESRDHRGLRTLRDLNADLLHELEQFFVSYNAIRGREFRVLGTKGPKAAYQALARAKRD